MILLGILQFLLNAGLAVLAFHVTVYPVDKKRDKMKIRVYYFSIFVCILGSGVLTYFQAKDSEKGKLTTEDGSVHSQTALFKLRRMGKGSLLQKLTGLHPIKTGFGNKIKTFRNSY